MDEESLATLGKRIREKRLSLEWTQEDLAFHSGIDRSYIAGIERGKRNLTFSALCTLCRALQCRVGDLAHDLPALPDT